MQDSKIKTAIVVLMSAVLLSSVGLAAVTDLDVTTFTEDDPNNNVDVKSSDEYVINNSGADSTYGLYKDSRGLSKDQQATLKFRIRISGAGSTGRLSIGFGNSTDNVKNQADKAYIIFGDSDTYIQPGFVSMNTFQKGTDLYATLSLNGSYARASLYPTSNRNESDRLGTVRTNYSSTELDYLFAGNGFGGGFSGVVDANIQNLTVEYDNYEWIGSTKSWKYWQSGVLKYHEDDKGRMNMDLNSITNSNKSLIYQEVEGPNSTNFSAKWTDHGGSNGNYNLFSYTTDLNPGKDASNLVGMSITGSNARKMEITNASGTTRSITTATAGETYYISGNIDDEGNYSVTVYSDAARTNEVNSEHILIDGTIDYNYRYAFQAKNGTTGDTSKAVWNNVEFETTLLTDGNLSLRAPNYMAHGDNESYIVKLNESDIVTDNSTVTSENSTVIKVDEVEQTLNATNDSTINKRIEITAEYEGLSDSANVTVATVEMSNTDILPPLFKLFAVIGDVGIQWLVLSTITIAVIGYLFGGLPAVGSGTVLMIFGWSAGWIPLGALLVILFFSIMVGITGSPQNEIE